MVAVGSAIRHLTTDLLFTGDIIQINNIKIKGNIPRISLEFRGRRTEREGWARDLAQRSRWRRIAVESRLSERATIRAEIARGV
jgi:hypothetical protein